jgi:hypothetical protein
MGVGSGSSGGQPQQLLFARTIASVQRLSTDSFKKDIDRLTGC